MIKNADNIGITSLFLRKLLGSDMNFSLFVILNLKMGLIKSRIFLCKSLSKKYYTTEYHYVRKHSNWRK